jgi:hypothetical protein
MISVPFLVVVYEFLNHSEASREGFRIIELTGVASTGTWTMEPVDGLNYWWKQFSPATIEMTKGETVVMRFHSADVYHQFYAPALGIGPLSVEPGHVNDVVFTAEVSGAFQYYCTYMCGSCHFFMRGWILISEPGQPMPETEPIYCPVCLPDFGDPPQGDAVALGEYLYRKSGCSTCHGVEGEGGVENYNYVNYEIAAHNNTASKIFLRSEDDAELILEYIQEGIDWTSMEEPPEITGFPIVKARYEAAVSLIREGKNAARLDLAGPEPPLQMPSWKYHLSDPDIDSIMAYFISLNDWEDY